MSTSNKNNKHSSKQVSTRESILASIVHSISEKDIDNDVDEMTFTTDEDGNKRMATMKETLGFVFYTRQNGLLFVIGIIAAIFHGLVYPALSFLLSNVLGAISASATSLEPVRTMAYCFMGIGVYSFVVDTIKTGCFEIASARATKQFQVEWFRALLRQDAAYFDAYDIAAVSSSVGSNAGRYRRGIGPKFAQGIQYGTIAIGGLIYALYSSWRITLVVVSVINCSLPFQQSYRKLTSTYLFALRLPSHRNNNNNKTKKDGRPAVR